MEPTDTSLFEERDEPAATRLVVEQPGKAPRVMLMVPNVPVRVGRADDLELSLEDPRVSRLHAVIHYDGHTAVLEDRDSSNGTWLGDQRVEGTATLRGGAVVRVGNTWLTLLMTDRRPQEHRRVVTGADPEPGVVAVDPASVALFALVRRLGASELSVLIQGETGTGKELIARVLHASSTRASKHFMAINCATLPDMIAESELFGHERGSFTGASSRKVGVFEAADGGTLLLDEVGELSASSQARLLRVLQERTVVRVGASRPISVDVRIVAATNRDLAREVSAGRFREDLYFRLNGVTIEVPALRARPRDIVPLAEKTLREIDPRLSLGAGVGPTLLAHRWPGNVRELRNAIECAAALAEDHVIRVEHLPASVRGELMGGNDTSRSPLRDHVDEAERKAIVAALESTGWNQSRSARVLGISRRALIYKMERYGLKALPNSARAS